MQKNPTQNAKKHQRITHLVTASIATMLLNSGCQTADSEQKREMAHVLTQQEILIEALVAEREQEKVKAQIAKSEALSAAETHLNAALNALKQSSQALKEVIRNEQL